MLSTDSLNRRGLFSPQAVHQLIADNDKGKIDASFILFSLMCIEIWCRNYLDKPVPTTFST
jgi:asparagine synthase (glutamine-hydrolysing)